MSSLESIGFYTLSDARAKQVSATSPMWRCELVLTDRCNFSCPYCRGLQPYLQGDIPLEDAKSTIALWAKDGLKNLRLSGGEPTMYPHLEYLVRFAKDLGTERIALSTNGSASLATYQKLLNAGINDFSVSLDACCSSGASQMAGCNCNFKRICDNIRFLSQNTYTTVGVVLNDQNLPEAKKVVEFADSLGVQDIRVIPAAQSSKSLGELGLDEQLLARHPILRYRTQNSAQNVPVRGIQPTDPNRCFLVRDDSAVVQQWHFPCIIYLREGGAPIGKVGPEMRKQRLQWFQDHDTHQDPICKNNCLDVCCEMNRKCQKFAEEQVHADN